MEQSELLSIIRQLVKEELSGNEARLESLLKSSIRDAVRDNQQIVLAEFQSGKGKSGEISKLWQVFTICLQVIVAGILGYLIWYTQTNTTTAITAGLDAQRQELSARYFLTQEFYKHKFAAYEEAYQQLTDIESFLHSLQLKSSAKTDAIDTLARLNDSTAKNGLYLAPNIADELIGVWRLGVQLPELNPKGSRSLEDLDRLVTQVKQHMLDELSGAIGKIARERNATNP